jgi:hypothetical protein
MTEFIASEIVKAADRLNTRKFASIRARGSVRQTVELHPFHVTGFSDNPEDRRDFDDIEKAVSFLHAKGFQRLESKEEQSWLIAMNGVENARGWWQMEGIGTVAMWRCLPNFKWQEEKMELSLYHKASIN